MKHSPEMYAELGVHRTMICDGVRTGAFWDAIDSMVQPGDVVLDAAGGKPLAHRRRGHHVTERDALSSGSARGVSSIRYLISLISSARYREFGALLRHDGQAVVAIASGLDRGLRSGLVSRC